ncbi:MAG: LPS assembly protein LptD [Candidatus Omnitrophota bacterium]
MELYSRKHELFFKSLFLFVVVIIFLSFPPGVFCDPAAKDISDSKSIKTSQGKPIVVDADDVEYNDQEYRIIGKGNVKINYEGVLMTCNDVIVDMKDKHAVATGNVILYYQAITMTGEHLVYDFNTKIGYFENYKESQGIIEPKKIEAVQGDQRILSQRIDFNLEKRQAYANGFTELFQGPAKFTGYNLVYDFNSEKGDFSDVKMEELPWYGRGEKAVKPGPDRIDFIRGAITTCDQEHPHYRLQARTIYYYPDDKIVAKNVLLFIGKLPVMYFPYWKQSLKSGNSNFSVIFGSRKQWGWFVLTTYRYDFNEYLKTRFHFDHRDLKGFASGVDAEYIIPDKGEGKIKTYYMNQRDKFVKNRQDEYIANNKEPELLDNSQEWERYRGQLKHRWQMNDSTLALLEYNKMSDINFTKDYLYREYEEDVQPISEGSVTHSAGQYNSGIYARKRTNRFYSEIERLPEATFNLNSWEVADTGFYYRNELAAANLNQKTANSAADTDVNRLDAYNEIKYPTKLPGSLDWINLTPYIGTRQTYYSKDRLGESEDIIRGIHYYGGDLSAKFFRIWDLSDSLFGVELNRLRHVVTPGVKYTYIHNPTIPSSALGAFDAIDTIEKTNFFTLGLSNYLQTKWKNPDNLEMEDVNLVYFYPSVDYYDKVRNQARHFSNINAIVDVYPYRWLNIDSDMAYNQYQRRFQTANIDVWANGGDKWKVGMGKRYERDISEQVTSNLYYKINRLWQCRVYGRYESYTEQFQQLQYTVYRDLHCWLMEITYDMKLNEDGSTRDRAFWFVFRLKAFPDDTPLQFNLGYDSAQDIRGRMY